MNEQDRKAIEEALAKIDFDAEHAKGILELLRDRGLTLPDARKALAIATAFTCADSWKTLEKMTIVKPRAGS